MVVAAGLLVWGFWANRHERQVRTARSRTNRAFLLFFLLIVAAVIVASRLGELRPPAQRPEAAQPPAGEVRPEARDGEERAEPYEPEFRWIPAAIAFLVAAGALVAVIRVGAPRGGTPLETTTDEELLDELDAALADSLDDLRAEPDPRVAVIAAYARTERALARFGLPRREAEAPHEYEGRVEPELREAHPSAHDLLAALTRLYERAKFSAHAVDRGMKDDAIATLERLRGELAAARA